MVFASMLGWADRAVAQDVSTPNFWDQRQRSTKPVIEPRERIRFLTSTDYPPFNFLDARGRLGGFNVDLARAICEELDLVDRCQIEARPFAELVPLLEKGEAEAVIAGVAITPESRRRLAFTESYLRYPARFVTRKAAPLAEPIGQALAGRAVGTVEGSAHAAMLDAFFPGIRRVGFGDRAKALSALKSGAVDTVFGDGIDLSFWLESEAADGCCAFSGGPYLSDRFLGEGLSIALARKDADLAKAFDYAIGQVVAKGTFSELLLRYFPVSAF
ncbi:MULTISPECIES: transporter substrate-binding domain-containing protein [unclassified Aureimonas]|uniref:transporter substrate-binding domain-containing protein n=1 Tax=unclassified Aureimonas TaxID=2615206 RepID=UPI001FCD0697|nr:MULTISPECIES: transporter substrate-binding domain-containing protein [unclassified Aureimonas]